MEIMRKKELEKIWKQLDGACEAIEKLQENGIDTEFVIFSDVVSLKEKVEIMIESKTRK